MVDKVDPVSATAHPSPTRVDHSTSITSEPDNAWVAERQSEITANLFARENERLGVTPGKPDPHDAKDNEGDMSDRHPDHHLRSSEPPMSELSAEEKLSGESDRIGSGNLDEDVPFGEHTGFL